MPQASQVSPCAPGLGSQQLGKQVSSKGWGREWDSGSSGAAGLLLMILGRSWGRKSAKVGWGEEPHRTGVGTSLENQDDLSTDREMWLGYPHFCPVPCFPQPAVILVSRIHNAEQLLGLL